MNNWRACSVIEAPQSFSTSLVTDVVARYGGDEFVVLLKGVADATDVMETEDKIRVIVEEPIPLEKALLKTVDIPACLKPRKSAKRRADRPTYSINWPIAAHDNRSMNDFLHHIP